MEKRNGDNTKRNPKKWLGQPLSKEISINRLEEQVNKRIDTLTDMMDELNERKERIQRKNRSNDYNRGGRESKTEFV